MAGLSLVTAPTDVVITLDDAKAHLRVTHDEEDTIIAGLVDQATTWAETFTERALLTQTLDYFLDAFPCGLEPIWLPKPPLASVTYIKYYDTAGTLQTWSSANYSVDAPAGPRAYKGKIDLAYGQAYPSTRYQPNAVVVRFVCGVGAGSVPEGIKSGMKTLIGSLFGPGRQSIVISTIVQSVPSTAEALLWPYKVW